MAYLPNTDRERREMLDEIGAPSVGELFRQIPERLRQPALELPAPLSELELAREMGRLADANRELARWDCFLGGGIYSRFIPAIVLATISRPEFYTAYTPYQAEASQGYLQTIFEFQSMVAELYDLDVANASMYDGATATAEGALLAVTHTGRNRILAAATLHPDTLAVLRTYAQGRGAELELLPANQGRVTDLELAGAAIASSPAAAVVVPQPNFFGQLEPVAELVAVAHREGALALVAADPVGAAVVEPPGAVGADLAAGDGQQLGIPPQLGGPTVGLLACRGELVRRMPGRLVGITRDSRGGRAYTLTLQTREQHIRRERATSNICTNHALMGLAATAYLAKMGEGGLRQVADISYRRAHQLSSMLASVPGCRLPLPGEFLWEFVLETPLPADQVCRGLADRGILAGHPLAGSGAPNWILVCATEMTPPEALDRYAQALDQLVVEGVPVGAGT